MGFLIGCFLIVLVFMFLQMRSIKEDRKITQSKNVNDYPYTAIVTNCEDSWDLPFKKGDHIIVLGEIDNCPGHEVIATKDGKVHWMFDKDFYYERLN